MEPGEHIGDYIIVGKIGEGRRSIVYLARHREHGNQAVVKWLRQQPAFDEPTSRNIKQLRHPHLAAVYGYIERDGQYFIVEEYLSGGSLADVLDKGEPISQERALSWCRDALRAIDDAHQSGIVHGDLKPGNLMLNQEREVKVTDFGVARVFGRPTGAGNELGTPLYMSPEQIRTPDQVDPLTDVYAMGVVLYELLTRRVPFDGETEFDIKQAVLREPPVPPRRLNPSISRDVERIVLKALQKRPQNRFSGSTEFARHIDDCLAPRSPRYNPLESILKWIPNVFKRAESSTAGGSGAPQQSVPAPPPQSMPPPPPQAMPPPPPQAGPPPGPPQQAGPLPPMAEAAEPEPEPVQLGASAPESVRPGDHFVAQFAAYVQAQKEEVRKAFIALSRRSEPKLGLKTCRWKLKTPVKVVLTGEYLKVDPPADEFVWEGSQNLLSFEVSVDAGAPVGTTVLKYHVYIGEVRVAMLPLEIDIGAQPASSKQKEVTSQPARTAFASYASEDRERVLDRVSEAGLSGGLNVFMDCVSLRAGTDWEQSLEQEITGCDLFLLFWSSHAKDSKWVTWEWQTALRQKGIQAIQLRPLQPVREVEPPEELKRLHFDDPLMVMREYYRMHPPGKQG